MSLDYLVFTNKNDFLIVGTNDTDVEGNAIKEGYVAPNIVQIPYEVNGTLIKEIGSSAFCRVSSIREVFIEAKITQINRCAFYKCPNLARINIPSTVTLMGVSAIDLRLIEKKQVSNGRAIIIFEQNSHLQYLSNASICNKRTMTIYICNIISPKADFYVFGSVSNLHIYSPYSFQIANVNTTNGPCLPSSLCIKSCKQNLITQISFRVYISIIMIK